MVELGLFFVALTVVGLVQTVAVVTAKLAEGEKLDIRHPFLWELTGAYCLFVLVPILLPFMRRFPVRLDNAHYTVPLHFLMLASYSCIHTLLMWGSRVLMYALLCWGPYDYGIMRYRFPMEAFKQIIAYWAIYAVITAVDANSRARKREHDELQLKEQLADARLAALKMQLNPHFLFNTLNTIASYVYEKPQLSEEMITHLADFLRQTLRHRDIQEVPLSVELDFLHSYLAIMQVRFEDRLSVNFTVPEELHDALVPHLILQPLVENSLTHAMANELKQTRIDILASRDGEKVRITVRDNGPGLPLDNGQKGGIGLANTRARLETLYGERHQLVMANDPAGGAVVEIVLPYHLASSEKEAP